MSAAGVVQSRVDVVRRSDRRGRLFAQSAGVRAVHGARRALLVANGAVIMRPHC